ncbi:MAG: CoA transferase, partial [Pseudomonadota bacterium]
AGPFCGSILGEFGAEVIKVEQPIVGDPLRKWGTPTEVGDTLVWLSDARNKKSITLELRHPDGAALFKKLVVESDVVIENFRPGTLEKWGLGYEDLKRINPELIMLRISGYGQTGPRAKERAFARIAHGFCGLSHLVGETDGPPLMPGSTALADYVSGTYGAVGVLMALRVRDRDGVGQYIDIGLYETMLRYLDDLVPAYSKFGTIRNRMGAEAANAVPHSHYRTRDGKWVAIVASTDKMFFNLAKVMGRPDLAGDQHYGKLVRRVEDRDDVNRIVGAWVAGLSRDEVLVKCKEGQVPCGPIYDIAEIFEDPQYAARGNLLRVMDERLGEMTVPSVVPLLSETPGRVNHLGPSLGAHNDEIYGDLLGLSRDQQEALKAKGVI